MKARQIEEHMTEYPSVVSGRTTVAQALELMEQFKVRHLPVVESGKLVGIISDRDLKKAEVLSESLTLVAPDFMTPDPYCVPLGTPLLDVVRHMERTKFGSAIVLGNANRVVGIFTTTDALRVLGQLLTEEKGSGALLRWKIEEALTGSVLIAI